MTVLRPFSLFPWHFRNAEMVLIAYFFYLSALPLWLRDRPHADAHLLATACAVLTIIGLLIWGEQQGSQRLTFSIARDWMALAFVLTAYRSLDWFSPARYPFRFEPFWLRWDVRLLEHWHLRSLIESAGPGFPAYLEVCYLLTSAAGGVAIAILYLQNKRERCDCFLLVYVLGTLLSYALIPFFPSQPPRIIYPAMAAPHLPDPVRILNFLVLSGAGIHAGVFPSAHVSSTFAAAWGMFLCLPERKMYGWLFLVYAGSVALATVYGRYHFAVDAAAGIIVSLLAWVVAIAWRKLTARIEQQQAMFCPFDPRATG